LNGLDEPQKAMSILK